jgi:hypothetical protein
MEDDGRFLMRGDEKSWHVLLVDERRDVVGCCRYLVHANTVAYNRLKVSHSALAHHPTWGPKVREAVESDLAAARANGFSYIEVGGWALAEEWRNTRAALEILVASYALTQLLGGAMCICTATMRHGSSSMLRRIGGSSLSVRGEELPSYEDPQYGCAMELVRFDTRLPSSRFVPLIAQLKAKLADSVAITPKMEHERLLVPEWGRINLLRMAPLHY